MLFIAKKSVLSKIHNARPFIRSFVLWRFFEEAKCYNFTLKYENYENKKTFFSTISKLCDARH